MYVDLRHLRQIERPEQEDDPPVAEMNHRIDH